MVTVQHLVKEKLTKNPFMSGLLQQGFLNVSAFAESFHAEIERKLGKKVKLSAIAMAVRRYGENESGKQMYSWKFPKDLEMSSRSGIYEVAIEKSDLPFSSMQQLYSLNTRPGNFLSILQGSYEIVFLTNQVNKSFLLNHIKKEKIVSESNELSYISINFEKSTKNIPGIYYQCSFVLASHDISVQSMRTIGSELLIFFKKQDLLRAYELISALIEK